MLLILAVVIGIVVGGGFTTWQLSQHDSGKFAWVVDVATDLPELEKSLNDFSEQGFGVHRILSALLETEQAGFVIVGRRAEHGVPNLAGSDTGPEGLGTGRLLGNFGYCATAAVSGTAGAATRNL